MNDQNTNEPNACDTVLDVQGMTCMSCIRHVNDALRDLDGVARIEVKLRDGIVIVRHDTAQAPVTLLVEALRDAGYESKPRPTAAV